MPTTFRAALLLLIGSVAGCALRAEPSGFAIANVTVIDAVHGVRQNQTVQVEGERIVSVSAADDPRTSGRIVDGSGMYLIPGLWDMHVHLTYEDALTPAMPALFIAHGVTSVRDTGGMLDELLPVIAFFRDEGRVAPRVFFSGPLLDGNLVVYDGEGRPEIGISNPDAARARANVATLKSAGASFIKIYELVSPEVFDALADAAAEHRLPIAAHVPLSMRASQVAPRVNSMEHLRNVEMDCASNAEELLAARKARLASHPGPGATLRADLHTLQRLPAIGEYDAARCEEVLSSMMSTIQVPTLRLNAFSLRPPFERGDWLAALERAPAEVRREWGDATEEWRRDRPASDTTFAAWSLNLVGQMHQKGVPIGAGTDTPINYALPGYSLHSELEMLVRAGLPPLEAIRAATLRPAEFFGLQEEMGTIEAGKLADLVLLSANPLQDITNTRTIEAVVSKGRLVSREQLAELR